jgi:Cu-Zn family superoxide dismutase
MKNSGKSMSRRTLLRAFAPAAFVALAGWATLANLPSADAQGQAQSAPAQGAHAGHGAAEGGAKEVTKAIAVLSPASGSEVKGTVTFTKVSDGVRVQARVEGLTPGPHGFHVHQFGDCSAPDATSAGGHFNPSDHPHGAPDADERHAGDMGNIEANDQGVATLDYVDKVMKLDGPGSIIGHAVIVHEKADDLKSQPTGDAGGRIACGVVGVANPEPAKQ